ncbi:MAG: hypothetical protein HY512_04365 [Candidatus Aenigmarchaeota archaeon]|nr:hypothetical protein [Candidatus Aenigmarchaeota archaeon]
MDKKIFSIVLVLIAIVLISGCAQSGPTIKVKSPANNSTLDGPDVTIEVETQNFKDGNVLVSIDNKTDYATSSKYIAKNLLPGEHTATFTLQKDGKDILENGKVITASVKFTIKGVESVFGKGVKDQTGTTKDLPTPPAFPPSFKK